MKVILFVLAIAMVGCGPPEPIPVAENVSIAELSGGMGWSVVPFNGHTYIERVRKSYGSYDRPQYAVSILHDPDCKCGNP